MFAGVVRREHVAAKAVGSFLPRLTRKAFERHGFAAATLLTDWARIVGAEVARYAQPERIKWPKGVATYGEVEAGAEGRPGGTLVLAVDPARAMDVEYRRAQLAERINGYFGYRAIAEIRVVQTPLGAGASERPAPLPASVAAGAAPRAPSPALAAIADDGLRQALARMQAGIEAKRAARG
ncbi:MAG: DciA family protein [Pseudomonadota bacterium]